MNEYKTTTVASEQVQSRDWSALRGELAVYLLSAVFIGLCFIGHDTIESIRELTAESKRLNQRLNADARLIQLAVETADPERQPERTERAD